MAYLNPQEAFEHLRDKTVEGLKSSFPFKGRATTLHLEDVAVDDQLHPDDIRSQHDAKINGKSWSVPVRGTLVLKNNETGEVLDKKKVRLADLPKMTRRYSYIIDGQEYQVDNQWQLKPGVYTRRRANGELESRFNVVGRSAFDVVFDPNSKTFIADYKKAKIPLYPMLKTLGVDDDTLEKSWGKDILEANKKGKRLAGAVEQFYKTTTKQPAPSREAAEDHLIKVMAESRINPEVTQVTLGKAFDHVTGEALQRASRRLLDLHNGHPEDDRDSLTFKTLRSTGDFIQDQMRVSAKSIQAKMQRQLNNPKVTGIRDVIRPDIFNEPIRTMFLKSAISNPAKQINPLEMVSAAMQTTIMGPGGIKSDRQVTEDAKMINVSHLGFLDPINTPEGEKTGVTLRLPIGLKKVGNEAKVPVFDVRSGKMTDISPHQFITSNIALPDQVTWKDGKPVPVSDRVKVVGQGNKIEEKKFVEADYVLRHPSQLFNITSNLIPFLGNNSGGRASMASRHMEQAISLINREAPLVQVATPKTSTGIESFEHLVGKQTAHFAPIGGVVSKVTPNGITISGKDNTTHEVQIYHHYPLNDAKSSLHSTPLVKVGDKVKPGQVVADTNYSKGGALALGTNLRVAYVPFKGYNFEDGVVISDSAAKKLASEHLHKHDLEKKEGMLFEPAKFRQKHLTAFTAEQFKNIDDHGVVRIGSKVKPGDPLIIATQPYQLKDRTGLAAMRKSLVNQHTDKSVRWNSDFEGEVVGVHKTGDKISVHVRTVEPMQVGDKIAGRYGNKGIVTKILPDHEMPHAGGKPTEVLLNPSGVPGRMNIGQVLETATSKIAEKTGKPYLVHNFDSTTGDYLEKVKGELKKHGISDTEHLTDPTTKLPLGEALVGNQYMMKLVHQVDKKLSVRSGMGLPKLTEAEGYDSFLQPTGGGHAGGQSLGALGLYSMLAHGAKANIREMQTWKSEGEDLQTNEFKRWTQGNRHNEIWNAIQNGLPPPPPRPTFAFHRFLQMLRGSGVNVEKNGHQFQVSPLTDKQILNMSAGELKFAGRSPVRAKVGKSGEYEPMPGGLFDEKHTGGHGGTKWSHIALAEPLPNPLFQEPIKKLTGLRQKQFDDILEGRAGVVPHTGEITTSPMGVRGGAGIKALLDRIDVPKDLDKAKKELNAASPGQVDRALKKVKYLTVLQDMKMKPSEAYVLHNLPVMPPNTRPINQMDQAAIKYEDINGLYMKFAQINDKLKDPILSKNLTDAKKEEMRSAYYDGVKAIMGIGSVNKDKKEKGILEMISGSQPKEGYFQKTLVQRRQDMTMRSTIVPEPNLGLDEVGLPREAALTLFRPFVVRRLVQQGTAANVPDAQMKLSEVHRGKTDPMVWRALDHAMNERPVLLKRDPALHKYSVQAFKAKTTDGNAIKIHPLVTGGFNADFDGDTMAVYVPISHEAVREAEKMYPTNNIFSESSGEVMYRPTLESALGLYKLSLTGKKTDHKFGNQAEVATALHSGKVGYTDIVHMQGKETTPGRVLLANILPKEMQPKVLHDLSFKVDKKGLVSLLDTLGKDHRHDFGRVINDVKDLGYDASYGIIKTDLIPTQHLSIGTHTLSLKDFDPARSARDPVLHATQQKVNEIYASKAIPENDKDRQAVNAWFRAGEEMQEKHKKEVANNPSNLYMMAAAGVKPSWDQYKQMVMSPLIMKDSKNQNIPSPIKNSYAEGLDLGEYWTQLHGARRGTVMKVQEVQEPGAMSKLLMNSSMNLMIDKHDCGTKKGVSMPISENDVHDRHLAVDFKAGGLHVPAGALMTPDLVGQIRSVDKNAKVLVRSPLKCASEKGICQKCMGPSVDGGEHPFGTNVGIQAAHAVGERAVQLTLKSFHTGGVAEAGGGSKALNSFARFEQLTKLHDKIPNSATVAMTSGKIDKIEKESTGTRIWVSGVPHFVGKDDNGMALHVSLPGAIQPKGKPAWVPPEVGMHVEAGHPLSDPLRTVINPHDLYRATKSMDHVQNHLADEIHDLYKDEGVRRRAVEVMVRAMSNLTKIEDPGDHPHLLRGEFYPTSVVNKMNQELKEQGKGRILHSPVLMGVDMLPLSLHDDWMARLQHQRLRTTIAEAAATGMVSNIHGSHPIPGVAYGAEFGLPRLARNAKGETVVPSHVY